MAVIQLHKCMRCGEVWFTRTPGTPKICRACRTPYWNTPKKERETQLRVQSFATGEEAMEHIKVLRPRLEAQPEREYDPNDPNADREGYIWVISVLSDTNADKLYLCTDGHIR